MFDVEKLGDQETVEKAVKDFFGDRLLTREELKNLYPDVEDGDIAPSEFHKTIDFTKDFEKIVDEISKDLKKISTKE